MITIAQKTVRVEIPTNPDALILLLSSIWLKHQADGSSSPLNGLGMEMFQTLMNIANAANTEMKRLYEEAKIETAKRDNAFGSAQTRDTLLYIVTQIRDLLLVIYKSNPRELGAWGFTVVEGQHSTGPKAAKNAG